MKLKDVLDRITLGRATIGDIGFVVKELRAAKADKGTAYWRERAEIAEGELRIAKREKRKAVKLLKGQMENDSRIIGKLKRENREMWKALSESCENHETNGECIIQPITETDSEECARCSCPLLKAKAPKGGI